MNRHDRRARDAKAKSEMQFVDVPMTGWHRPEEWEIEGVESIKTGHPVSLPEGTEIYLSDGDHPDWLWVVMTTAEEPKPTAHAMYGKGGGQSFALPEMLAVTLVDLARKQSGVEVIVAGAVL